MSKLSKNEKIILFLISFMFPLAILPKELFFGISILTVLFLIALNKKIYRTKFLVFVVLVTVVHFLSSTIYFFSNKVEFSRYLAAINTALSWLIAGLIISFRVSYSDNFKSIIRKVSLFNLSLIFVLTFLAQILAKNGIAFNLFGRNLYINDWTSDGLGMRTLLFFDYSSLIGFFSIINLALFIRKKIKLFDLFVLILMIYPVYLSKSRICLVSILAFAYTYVFIYIRLNVNNYKIYLILLVLASAVVVFAFNSKIIELFNKIFLMRENSNVRRFELYQLSISKAIDFNPILGCGIKVEYSHNVPYGSHSTFVGLFYKLGFVGCLISTVFVYELIKSIIKTKNYNLFAYFIALLIIIIFEDMDGTNWLVLFVFLTFGYVEINGLDHVVENIGGMNNENICYNKNLQ